MRSISGICWRKRIEWEEQTFLKSLPVGAVWIHSFNSLSKQSLSSAAMCALLEPEEHWEDLVGIWASFQGLVPPEV